MIYHNSKKAYRVTYKEVYCCICKSSLGFSSIINEDRMCEKCELKSELRSKRLEKLKKLDYEN